LRLSTFGLRTQKLEVRAIGTTIEFVAGLGLVLLVLSDISRTILLPRPTVRALRLSPLLGRLFVPLWVQGYGAHQIDAVAPDGAGKPRASSDHPRVAFLGGAGLMIHADSKDIGPAVDLSETVYLAGSAFFTLGVGNSIVNGPARFLVVLAGLSGLASVTIGATFLLTVQQALHRREVLVLSTLPVAGRPPSGLVILETYGLNEAPDALAELFRDWEKWAADVLHSHRADPVLAHFRSTDEGGEWLAVFGAVIDAAALLLAATETQRPTAPAARMFLPIGCRTVGSLERLFAVQAAPTRDATVDREQFKVMRERLRSAGYSLCKPEDAAYIRFQQLREDYRPDLIALCRHLRILLPEPPLQGSQPEIARPKRKRTPTTQAEVKA